MKALDGIRVLDMSRILAGPWASQLMADMGASVIKVEQPGRGDDTRHWGPPWLNSDPGALSAYFLACNRGKQSVCIDFSHPEGQALLRELAADSDILLENFRPGSLARYGLDHDSLRKQNPGLIYCSITGFGQDGPYAQRNGYDLLLQAMGGLMSITGSPAREGGEPAKVGVAVTDILTGLYATIACLGALREREAGAGGQHIDMALMDVQVATLANQAMNYLVGGEVPQAMGHAHPNIVPYQAFEAVDGWLVIAAGNDKQFQALCDVLDLPDLARDPAYARNADRVAQRAILVKRLAAVIRRRPRGDWLAALERAGVPAGPVNDMAAVMDDPQVRARGLVQTLTHPRLGEIPTIASPIRCRGGSTQSHGPPPALGQDTQAVLMERLGLDEQRLSRLRAEGVIR
ncbi:CaiB/BaiF CoA transferase family protein [Natronospira bacteriovora]|uniref:CaiB/BaiF CoA-transferase family protein n=1 Tax=Natronospira bacteriovora TaxID=3069753 RepID=A0ABU0WA15_9GAMM|nr:CaiB/BaiF CoA-transferase family protein [Natronospira sp. AB-CW4]MDQ2070802.1 CaiB/BaiF CoA-transferase family protein [Natronospira sp. AB-CW4]